MSHPIDHTGKKYGRLTAIRRDFDNPKSGTYWICQCECGTEKSVPAGNLTKGMSRSCGCLQRERTSAASVVHGCTRGKRTSEYMAWRSMRNRCERPQDRHYRNYGGRGIAVCEQWKTFANFLADMGLKPTAGHALDRIDNDGNYEPGNCRWVTCKENNRNRRSNHLVESGGETKTLIEWCEQFAIPYQRTLKRLKRGWSPEEAFAK